jgi:hypothetical protein
VTESPWKPRREIHRKLAPPPYCPACGKKLDAATSLKLDGAHPKPGNITICIGCAAVSQFHGSPLQLRLLEGDDLTLALADPWVRKTRLALIVARARRDRRDD